MTDNTHTESQPAAKPSMMPDWAVNAFGYTCFIGALAAEGLLAVYSAVAGTPPEKLPAPLANFMGREP